MTWKQDRRVKIFIISAIFGFIGLYLTIYQAHQDALIHDQNQQLILYDMKVLLDNQKVIQDNLDTGFQNSTLKNLNSSRFLYHYDERTINPLTGSP